MGADGWENVGPWHEDPSESLRALQRRQISQRYDLPTFIADRLADAREALELTRTGKSSPSLKAHLLEVYGADVAYLGQVQSQPLPTELSEQLELVRRICGADGCGGVLNVTSVADASDPMTARRLSNDELIAALKTARPTAADVRQGRFALPIVGRGECICFPLYDEGGTPIGWQFLGAEFD